MKAISLIPKYFSKFRVKQQLHTEQKSVAANLPVELLIAILSSTILYIPGPLPDDARGLSELYDVTWGGLSRNKAFLSAAGVCRAWNRVAAVLLYETIYVSSIKTLELLLKTLKSQSWQNKQLRISDIVLNLVPRSQRRKSRARAEHSVAISNLNTLAALRSFAPTARVHLHSPTTTFRAFRTLAIESELTRSENIESLHLSMPIRMQIPTDVRVWPEITGHLRLPNLRTLSLLGMHIHESSLSDDLFPSLSRLKITDCSFSESENSSLDRLSYLYIRRSYSGWKSIQHLIRASAETLEFLAIEDTDPLPPHSDEQPDGHVPLAVRQQVSTLPRLRKLFLDGYVFPCSLPILDIPPSVEEFGVSSITLYSINRQFRTSGVVIDHVLRHIGHDNESKLKTIFVRVWGEDESHAELKDIPSRCTELGIRFNVDFKYVYEMPLNA